MKYELEMRQKELRRSLRDYFNMIELRLPTLCAGTALSTMLEFMHEVYLDWMDDDFEVEDQIIISGYVRPHYEIREVRTLGLFKRQRRIAVPPGRFILSVFRSVDTSDIWAEAGLELEFNVRDFQGLEEFEISSLEFTSVRDFLSKTIQEPAFIRANGLPALDIRLDWNENAPTPEPALTPRGADFWATEGRLNPALAASNV
jgi:hypothetical protein